MPKMPTLGPQPRKSGSGPVVFLLVCFAAASFGYAWWTKHKGPVTIPLGHHTFALRPPAVLVRPAAGPAPTPAPAPVVAEVKAPPPAPAVPAGPRHISFSIDGPLETAIVASAGREVGPALAQVVTRALVWWIAVPGDLRRGDKLDVVYEERGNEEPQVDAVRLVSGKFGKTFQAYRYTPAGEAYARFYQPNGEELERRLRVSPLDTYEQITSLIHDGRHHKGVDFKTPVGTQVKATFAGTIMRKNWKWRANGNCLELVESSAPYRHALYLHLSELPKSFAVGRKVGRGEVIANSGNTGHSFAPHLHYQLMSADDRVLDPFESQESFHRSLPVTEKAALDAAVAHWTTLMGPSSPAMASGT